MHTFNLKILKFFIMKKLLPISVSPDVNTSVLRILFMMIFVFAFSAINAQLNIPLTNCQNIPGTYTDLGTNGSAITTANFDDANSSATNIGFSFNFNGQAFTQFVLNTNGFIRLGSSPPSSASLFFSGGQSYTGGPFASTNAADVNLISAFNMDLIGGTNPEFRVHTSGTAPNRVCVIQFKNMRDKTTSPPEQFANINFQIHLYEGTNIIEFVYGTFTPTANAENWKSCVVGLKGSGSMTNQMVTVTKGSTTIWSGATFLSGNYTGNSFNVRKSVLPDAGRTLRFMPIVANDLAIMEAYVLGKAPIPFGNPQTITAWVKNGGTNTMLSAACTLTITGANSFTNVQTVPTLTSGDSVLITFAPFSPANVGINNVEVTLPPDDNPLNNIKTKIIETNANSYSYAQGPTPSGGVGFNGNTGDFIAKFTTSSTQSINQVNVNFANFGQPFQIGIWAANAAGTPGALLHSTPTYTSTLGEYTVLIDPPVSIPTGSFFVGVRQTGTTNISFAYQTENPIRSGTFYFTSPSGGTTWSDFAPNNHFRFMVEPRFALQTDVGIIAATPATGNTLVAGGTYDLGATVVNYGLNAQNNIPVYYYVNQGTPVGPVNTTSSINLNGTTTVSFTGANAFSPTTPGTYTVKYFTQLTNDLNVANDTLVVVYTVIPAPSSTFPYNQNFTAPQNWTISGSGSLWRYGIATGSTGQPNDTAVFADFYGASIGNTAMLKSPAFNISGMSNPTIQFDVSYRTKTTQNDTLQVMVSTDGGLTFVPGTPPIYRKSALSNPSLATLAPDTGDYTPAASTHWRRETVSLLQFGSATNLIFAFKANSANGNNCWVDNVTLFDGQMASVTTSPVTNLGSTFAVAGGNVTSAGTSNVTARGVCWNTSPNPTTADPKTTDGTGSGPFTSNITGLTAGTTYYMRAYATNGVGTAYGNEISFTTMPPPTAPVVITLPITGITHFSAVAGGNVTSHGGVPLSARGICYSILPNPTISDAFTNEGTDTGSFTSNLTGLDPSTTYYVKAYATNSIGISYGNEEIFSTLVDAIDEANPDRFSIFVSGNQLSLTSDIHRYIDNLKIIDITGRIAAEYRSLHCAPSVTLTLPDLAVGTYVIRLIYEDKMLQQKFVISKP